MVSGNIMRASFVSACAAADAVSTASAATPAKRSARIRRFRITSKYLTKVAGSGDRAKRQSPSERPRPATPPRSYRVDNPLDTLDDGLSFLAGHTPPRMNHIVPQLRPD